MPEINSEVGDQWAASAPSPDPVSEVRGTTPDAREAHPFERGGVLSTTCARSDCWQAPTARIHRVTPAVPAGPEAPREELRTRLLELLGPSHPHDEGRECGTCAPYNLLVATPAGPEERGEGLDMTALAQSLRYVERTMQFAMGVKAPDDGPPDEWYDGYARNVAKRYAAVLLENHDA